MEREDLSEEQQTGQYKRIRVNNKKQTFMVMELVKLVVNEVKGEG